MSEEINIPKQSQTLKTAMDDCYLYSVKNLQLYKTALRRRIGNHNIYWTEFVAGFEALFIFTSVDPSIQKEKLVNGGGLLVNRVSKWLENGNAHHKEGEKLFLAYRKALFDRAILSF